MKVTGEVTGFLLPADRSPERTAHDTGCSPGWAVPGFTDAGLGWCWYWEQRSSAIARPLGLQARSGSYWARPAVVTSTQAGQRGSVPAFEDGSTSGNGRWPSAPPRYLGAARSMTPLKRVCGPESPHGVAGRGDWPARTQDAKPCIEPKGDFRSGGWGLAKLLHGAVSGAGHSLQTCKNLPRMLASVRAQTRRKRKTQAETALAATRNARKSLKNSVKNQRNGSPSSLDIEPFALRRALISGAFWRMFASLALRHNRLA